MSLGVSRLAVAVSLVLAVFVPCVWLRQSGTFGREAHAAGRGNDNDDLPL